MVVGLFLFACGFLQKSAASSASPTIKPPTVTPSPISIPSETPTLTPSLTPTQTLTPTPSSTPTPTPKPAFIPEWENLQVDTVCIEGVQEYPQFDKNVDLPVYDTVTQILNAMGIETSQGEDSCQAALFIEFEGTVFSDTYSSGSGETVECYTGARVTGNIRILKDGYTPIEIPFKASYAPQAVFGGCSKEPSSGVNWDLAWIPEVTQRLADIWGAPVAAAALKVDQIVVHSAGVSLVKRFGPQASEAVPHLIAILTEYASTDAAEALDRIGPAAMPAVPILIERLGEELKSTSPVNFAYYYSNALESITGIQFNDSSMWLDWWNEDWVDLIHQTDTTILAQTLIDDPDAETRRMAAIVLAYLAPKDQAILQALTKALSDDDLGVRVAVLKAIGNFGPDALPILPVLIELGKSIRVSDKEWGPLEDALKAIGIEAIPALVEAAQAESETQSKFLWPLRTITGDKWDNTLMGNALERAIAKFLERCMDYYHDQTGT